MPIQVLTEQDVFAPDDRIFLGEGLFETLRVVNARPCFSLLHWQRLKCSAQKLSIPFELSYDDWHELIVKCIKHDGLVDGGVKFILAAGKAARGLTHQAVISKMLVHSFTYTVANQPLRLMSSSWLRDAANPLYQLKSINYLEAISARRSALANGLDDVLFFNTAQHATETSCANIFIISNNQLITPPQADGVLPGITRFRILSLCNQHGISFSECSVTQNMLQQAQAVFITNSLQGIQVVSVWDETSYALNHPLIAQLNALIKNNE